MVSVATQRLVRFAQAWLTNALHRVIDFSSEAVEHDCSGPDCYELREAREFLELPPN
jgi:hypothetical protein